MAQPKIKWEVYEAVNLNGNRRWLYLIGTYYVAFDDSGEKTGHGYWRNVNNNYLDIRKVEPRDDD